QGRLAQSRRDDAELDDKLVESSKAVYDVVLEKLPAMLDKLADQLRAEMNVRIKDLQAYVDDELGRLEERLGDNLREVNHVKSLYKGLERVHSGWENSLADSLRQLSYAVASLEAPQVLVPPDAIKMVVQQVPSVVHVQTPPVNVTVPG